MKVAKIALFIVFVLANIWCSVRFFKCLGKRGFSFAFIESCFPVVWLVGFLLWLLFSLNSGVVWLIVILTVVSFMAVDWESTKLLFINPNKLKTVKDKDIVNINSEDVEVVDVEHKY